MEERKYYKSTYQNYCLQADLDSNVLTLEITSQQLADKMFYAEISEESCPESLKNVFDDPSQIYDFISEEIEGTEKYQILNPSELRIMVKIGKATKPFSIKLNEKELSRDKVLEKQINALQLQVDRLK